ncbi:MAG: preprotein translocase subunit SecG [Oscillospiraceae bacterium]|nr:preprotein translocase subunit SecG [Oscillospiraceae bacterium]
MSAIEIVGGVLLILCCVFLVVITLMQSQKQQGMTSAVQGSNNDSFYNKNAQNTREKALEKLTKIVAFLFFAAVVAINIITAVSARG